MSKLWNCELSFLSTFSGNYLLSSDNICAASTIHKVYSNGLFLNFTITKELFSQRK